jgi:hypothetical protein
MAVPWKIDDTQQSAQSDAVPWKIDDTQQPKQADSFLSRVGTGLADAVYGAGQIADKAINPIRQAITPGAMSMDDVIREREQSYNAPEGFDAARMAGNVINPLTWVGPGKAKVFQKVASALAAAPVRTAAATGAAQSVLTPTTEEDFWTEKAKQAALGATVGAGVGKLTRGFTPTPEAQALIDQGIQPSFGQSMGGIANTVEQKLTSLPAVGDAINWARNRAQREFEGAVLKRETGIPLTSSKGGIVTRASKDAPRTLDEANAIASQRFNAVVPNLKQDLGTWVEPQLAAHKAMVNPEMTDQNRRILQGVVAEMFDPGNLAKLDAEGLKKLDSQLGFLVRKYQGGDPASKTLADEFRNVQKAFRDNLDSLLPADMKGSLNEANKTWAKLVPVNKAASQRADEKIMPRALQRAMAAQARTDVSRMPADSLVDNAVKVLPSTVPDSGTAGRAILGSAGLYGSGTLGVLPEYLTAGAIAGLGATRPVQRALVGNTAWQQLLGPQDQTLSSILAAALRGKREQK